MSENTQDDQVNSEEKVDFQKPIVMDSNYFTFNVCKKQIRICKPLLLLKVCIFLYYGAGSFMAPFLTVLFKERGVSLTALSLMLMLSPIVQAFITTISGIVADKIGRAKPVFTANTFVTVSLVLSIIFLPQIPKGQKLDVLCDADHEGYVTPDPPLHGPLETCHGHDKSQRGECGDVTYVRLTLVAETYQAGSLLNTRAVTEDGFDNQMNATLYRAVTEDGYDNQMNATPYRAVTEGGYDNQMNTTLYRAVTEDGYDNQMNTTLHRAVTEDGYDNQMNTTLYRAVTEDGYDNQMNTTLYRVVTKDGSNQNWCSDRPQCFLSCRLVAPTGSNNGLLIAYSCIYVVFLSTFSTAYRMLDVTVMFMVKEHHSNFGHERFFAVLGMVLTAPLAGYIADVTALPGTTRNYTSALYFFIALCGSIMPFLYKMPMRVRPRGENMWKKATELSRNPEVLAFFLLMIVLGAGFNLVKNFLFWYLEGLKASSLLIGLITSVNALYGLPFLLTSHWWVKRLGATQIFVLGCVGYAVNGIGYSLITNPWYSLMLESTGIFTYYLLWVAAVEYSHDIAPEGLTATVISIAGGLHYSVGKVTAGLIGKFVMNVYGGAIAFRFFAVTTLTAGALYSAFLCIRKRQRKRGRAVRGQ